MPLPNRRKLKPKPELGRQLIKTQNQRRRHRAGDPNSDRHTEDLDDGYDWARLNVKSVTEQSNLEEFLSTAELAGAEFSSEKENLSLITTPGVVVPEQPQKHYQYLYGGDSKDVLSIPRRPQWTSDMKRSKLIEREKESFLNWRRGIAKIQEERNAIVTPFEKNLDFWRQLWRVVERSHVVVQVVDARNPLLFYSRDLDTYVKEVDMNKESVVLMNKSDFLTDDQIKAWSEFFSSISVRVLFFSAVVEDESGNQVTSKSNRVLSSAQLVEELRKIASDVKAKKTNTIDKRFREKTSKDDEDDDASEDEEASEGTSAQKDFVTVGLVGYPNVGKSSTINALMTVKKVSTSATPGKTKHFQTIFLDDSLCLCDCPGLVFPSFVSSKADMVVNGILSIDQMTDHVSPVNIICSLFPRNVFEAVYGINLKKDTDAPLNSEELLSSYGYARGFMTSRGLPNQPRTARLILKDFVNGRLLYCHAPPGVNQEDFHEMKIDEQTKRRAITEFERRVILEETSQDDFDREFFEKTSKGLHAKGVSIISSLGQMSLDPNAAPGSMLPPKGFKRAMNRNKKEKLRKVYGHHDL